MFTTSPGTVHYSPKISEGESSGPQDQATSLHAQVQMAEQDSELKDAWL